MAGSRMRKLSKFGGFSSPGVHLYPCISAPWLRLWFLPIIWFCLVGV